MLYKIKCLENSCLSLGKNKQQNIRVSFAILSEPSQEEVIANAGMDAGKEKLFTLGIAINKINKEIKKCGK